MNDIVAFIVGIESYDEPDWSVAGPCRNALGIARYLLAIGARPENVLVFANLWEGGDAFAEMQPQMAELAAQGVVIEPPTFLAIDNGFRDLPVGRQADSRLFFYWSGHGYMDRERSRIFICQDYRTDTRVNRVFDATRRFLHLRSVRYGVFTEQILLADVCAQYVRALRFSSDEEPVDDPLAVRRIEMFATPDGEYARARDGMGAFTSIALTNLRASGGWPNLEQFGRSLAGAARAADVPPLLISGWTLEGALPETHVGRYTRGTDDAIVHVVYEMLSNVSLSAIEFSRHYAATMDKLQVPELGQAQGLLGMVRELSSLRDGITSGRISRGLLEFLMRISRDPENGRPVRDWLDRHPGSDINAARATIRHELDVEQDKKILIVEIEHDHKGDLAAFSSFVCLRDRTRMGRGATPRQPVGHWDDFCDKLRSILDELDSQSIELSQIYFAVEPPLFGLPFNLIERTKGDADSLGDHYVVLVRYRRPQNFRQFWLDYAQTLHACTTKQIKWIQIPADVSALAGLLSKKGLCYAGFVVTRSAPTPRAPTTEQQIILRLLRSGVPYLCWLHGEPASADWHRSFKRELARWLKVHERLSDIPVAVHQRRIAHEIHARNSTLLWDDPRFDPFSTLNGVPNG